MTENSVLKLCIKGHKSIFSGTRGDDKNWLITCLTCERKKQFFTAYASTEEKAILLWNTRPLEEAVRQKQFEVDCKVVESLVVQTPSSMPKNICDGYDYQFGVARAIDTLRRAWEERHDKDRKG